jgi:hypothetical protein
MPQLVEARIVTAPAVGPPCPAMLAPKAGAGTLSDAVDFG